MGWLLVGDSHKVGRFCEVVLTGVCKVENEFLIRGLELTYRRILFNTAKSRLYKKQIQQWITVRRSGGSARIFL